MSEKFENNDMDKINMDSLVTVMKSVEALGFTSQFEVSGNSLRSFQTEETFEPSDVTITHFYRFEGESNPDDSAILYAIKTSSGEKGTLVDGYGSNSDTATGEFIEKVKDIHK